MKKRFFIIAFLVAFALAFYFSGGYLWLTQFLNPDKTQSSAFVFQSVDQDVENRQQITLLLLGVDERAGDVGRSDTIILVVFNQEKNSISLLSIPRDTLVSIPGFGWDKINHSYAYGNVELTKKTVESFLHVPVDYYAVVNFQGFKKLIDAIGGVDIDVETTMQYEDPYDGIVINLKPGRQHLDGNQAIQYVRYRADMGDIGRVARQQKFIKAVLEKVYSPRFVVALPSAINEAIKVIKTNFPLPLAFNIATNAGVKGQPVLSFTMIPGHSGMLNEVSYWHPDIAEVNKIASSLVYGKERIYDTNTVAQDYKKYIETAEEKKVPDEPKPEQPAKPSQVKIEIVNASGEKIDTSELAKYFTSQGFLVVNVIEKTSVTNKNKTAIVCSNTTADDAKAIAEKFPKSILIVDDAALEKNKIKIIIGSRQ